MEIKARVPGMVQKINVKVGDQVKKMDVVAVLEAMKIEQNIPSPTDGEVTEINVEEGDRIQSGKVLMVIE